MLQQNNRKEEVQVFDRHWRSSISRPYLSYLFLHYQISDRNAMFDNDP